MGKVAEFISIWDSEQFLQANQYLIVNSFYFYLIIFAKCTLLIIWKQVQSMAESHQHYKGREKGRKWKREGKVRQKRKLGKTPNLYLIDGY